MLHIPPTKILITSPLNPPKNNKKKIHTKEPAFRKMKVSGKRSQENGPKAEKDKTERATGLGRRTKDEIQKSRIKLTARRFQTGGRYQKYPASLQG